MIELPETKSSDSSESSNADCLNQSSLPVAYLEAPTISLVHIPFHEMTDAQMDAVLNELKDMAVVPGAFARRIKDESTLLKAGKAPRVTKNKKLNISDLL